MEACRSATCTWIDVEYASTPQLVLSTLKPTPRTYASSLLTAVECLVPPTICPPAIASEINGGGFLEPTFPI